MIDETLRLFPIVDSVFRMLRKPWSFGGYEVPAGVSIGAAILLVHRRPDVYPEPDSFRPERFLEGKPRHWRGYYDGELAAFVADRWRREIEHFGFRFEAAVRTPRTG